MRIDIDAFPFTPHPISRSRLKEAWLHNKKSIKREKQQYYT
jgi:hypothetical protein